jgi:2-hydroxychromene-2-carboxylate isomerase
MGHAMLTATSQARGRIEFWFDFASTYSYLTAMRIDDVAQAGGLEVVWKPFLLGPIFAAQGWNSSPFNLFPAKGRYMARDMQRIALSRGLTFRMPEPFPQHSVAAARLALVGLDQTWGPALCRAIFQAEFAEGCNISEPATLHHCLDMIGVPRRPAMEMAVGDEIKSRLRLNTQTAQAYGLFGAPSLRTIDGEVFWGDDRLEQAVAWGQQL